MIRHFFSIVVLFMTTCALAQEGATRSPYSFFGVGIQQFRGTVEARAMGGTQTMSDSIHLNLLNPASLGRLRYTTLSVGANHSEITVKDSNLEESTSSTTFDYLALGFPLSKKIGVSFGLMPFTAVGYNIDSSTDVVINRFTGRGGLNRVFLAAGYEILNGLTVGASGNYNFGNIQNEAIRTQENVQFGTSERNRTDLQGLTFELGAQYETKISKKLSVTSSAKYVPGGKINADNFREVSTVFSNNLNIIADVDLQEVILSDTDFQFPTEVTLGLGFGEVNKWFVGGEYTNRKSSNFTNRTFTIDNATFEDASQYRLGGFYSPKYNSVTSYWQRVSYRAGFRFEESGIVIGNEGINEFGISFGIGFPSGRVISSVRNLSNLNLTFEYGQRGTTNAGLVQEDFFNVGISLSLNSLWFQQSKFN